MPGTSSINHSADLLFELSPRHRPDTSMPYQKALEEYIHDIGKGIETLLALIELHEAQEPGVVPSLATIHKCTLLRMATASSQLLAHFAYAQISTANRV